MIELEEPWTLAPSKWTLASSNWTLAAPWKLDADLCALVENVSENVLAMLILIHI